MWITFGIFLLIKATSSLTIISLDVPRSARFGEKTRLTCNYDLEKDSLYSVKWYKDDLEFFRYVPKDIPQRQFFPLDGIKIDFTRSNHQTVYIEDIQTATSGRYRCEVSADAPSFRTVSSEKIMVVKDAAGSALGHQGNKRMTFISFTLLLVLRKVFP
ncbi:uncharacterized protein LOC143239116 [Tachypleus tridentatus]|uniref:uncharacterized protein LOC143239116 n=1 Tax=Tachypleus tridentatus TaxID=6853 RepID=UPI003FCEF774